MPRKPKTELDERAEAATSYAKENPKHFIEYCLESEKESEKTNQEIRELWADLWEAYCNKMDFGDKEDWQSKVILDKPFTTVQQAKAIVRKALENPDYFTISGVNLLGKQVESFIKAVLNFHLDEQRANFKVHATDAVEMGFITGQSMEIIPQWDEYSGLSLTLVPPWHIYRDPDAIRRSPWSGLYWIHKEWIDIWELLEGHKQGIFNANVKKVEPIHSDYGDKYKAIGKKNQIWYRNKFRKSTDVHEFWGVVLDPKGELLLKNATFTVAGNQLIRNPRVNPYVKIRWPGVSFSPFAHLLRFEGRGLLEGVLTLWWLHNNMISLHADALSWAVNRIKEVDPSLAKFATNLEIAPGSIIEKKAGTTGNVVTEVTEVPVNQEMIPVFGYYDQLYENGSMVNQFIQGSAGTRADITKGEVEIKTQMSLGIFDSIGSDIESGLVNAIQTIVETIILNWGSTDMMMALGDDFPMETAALSKMDRREKIAFLKQNAIIRIQGISAQLKQSDMLMKLQAFIKRLESPMWSKYVKPFKMLQNFAKLIGYERADFIVTEAEAQMIDQVRTAIDVAAAQEEKEVMMQEVTAMESKPMNKSITPKEPGNPGVGDLSGEGF